MLNVCYTENGVAFSDFQLETCIEDIKMYRMAEIDYTIKTSTENLIYAIRKAIYKGELDHNYITLHYPDRLIKLDRTARPINGSFPDTWLDNCLDTLIGLNPHKEVTKDRQGKELI